MIRQKKGFWLFLFSLIPGAGEMYMGFQKQGISIMLLFWSMIAFSAGTGMGWILMFLPVLWFYSFFHVHNLKALSEEEFYTLEDNYILHLDQVFGDMNVFIQKYRVLVAVLLIIFGVSILCNNFADILYWLLPNRLGEMVHSIAYQLPQIILAVAIVLAGFYVLSSKKSQLPAEKKEKEPVWKPYTPPHQEAAETENATAAVPSPSQTQEETDNDTSTETDAL